MSIKIDQALTQGYITGSFGLSTAYENMPFSPVAGTPWAEVRIFRNEAAADTMGTAGKDETTGLLQIILRYPPDGYSIDAKTKADALMAYFTIGKVLTYSGQDVEITKKDRGSGRVIDGWYELTLRFTWAARTARTAA